MVLKSGKMWLLTAALLLAPLGGVILILYGAGRLALRKRLETTIDPYAEWLALRDRMRSRAPDAVAGDD
jgi:hypothetical protein